MTNNLILPRILRHFERTTVLQLSCTYLLLCRGMDADDTGAKLHINYLSK